MRSSVRFLIATAATTKTCVFANALESRRRATRFYCCGQVGGQEYSEFSSSTLLISSAPGNGTNRQLGIFRNSEYRKFTYANVALYLNRRLLHWSAMQLVRRIWKDLPIPTRVQVHRLSSVLAVHEGVPRAMDHHSSGCLPVREFPTFASRRPGRGATMLSSPRYRTKTDSSHKRISRGLLCGGSQGSR